MEWLVIDEKYLDYLRRFEKRIPLSDYGKDKYKPFFGTLFETEDCYYVTQVSHAQDRHLKMKNNLDFIKIYDPKDNHLLCVVNLNYMFPIPKGEKNSLKYRDVHLHRNFETEEEKSKYIDLMKTELAEINKKNLQNNALKLYDGKYKNPESFLSKRCLDFKFLEKKAVEYKA